VIRSNFKPMPADVIDDEDERCRVRHDAFVASHKPRKRPSDFWFGVCAVIFAVVIIGALFLVFTHHH
jgi:hypothetical protein